VRAHPDAKLLDLTDGQAIAASHETPEAFEVVFERHFAPIQRYLERRVGPSVGSDLAAEVFVVAFSRRAAYDPADQSALPWLFGIAANLLRSHRRVERARRRAYAKADARARVREAKVIRGAGSARAGG
jgi:DNA-directed RNA polymerase specialized sigma24 family protein